MIGDELQGRYRILNQLGSGGMGEVYLAQHVRLERLEAVKVLKRSMAGQFAGRFRREARAMNRLCHPNIVTVYDFGQLEDGRFFLSMEYAEGGSVKDVIQYGGRLGTDRAINILLQLSEAVHHAHEKGVIHRDLKPANMILIRQKNSPFETLKILDFGVAKILWEAPEAGMGTGNLIMGTPAYMAPELFAGVGDDPRSDIYSIGCIAFELVCGRAPFSGRPIEIADQHMSVAPPRPSELIEDSGERPPKELEDVIAWCLQKKPDDRPSTGAEVADALRGVLRVRRQAARSPLSVSTLKQHAFKSAVHGAEDDTATEDFVRASTTTGAETEQEMLQFEFRLLLKRLGESLIDAGCTDAKLLLTLANVNRADGDLARVGGEIQDIHREHAREDQSYREMESSLRFSLGELQYARRHGDYSGEDAAQMLEAIAQHHAQLREIERDHHERFSHREEREIELVARQSNLEEARDQMYETLDEIVLRLGPDYRSLNDRVAMLMDAVDERRDIAAGNSASSLPVR